MTAYRTACCLVTLSSLLCCAEACICGAAILSFLTKHGWVMQGLVVLVCSGPLRAALGQGFKAFLTNTHPPSSTRVPPLRIKALCWVSNHSSSCNSLRCLLVHMHMHQLLPVIQTVLE